ncbi:hypothetical protein [Ohessyouella blattaphilus]|uniref:tellurite resistance TerB family protein n=1 Tax=Ohessyouella blattaphilus TaxID=2949333 RepID=UPI003EBC084F
MMADGDISFGEEKIFGEICNEMGLQNLKNEIIEKCKELAHGKKDILNVIVNEKIDDEARRSFFGLQNKSVLVRIIWNLVNLGYADSVFSKEEQKIVSYLVTKWSIEKDVFQEFLDTADTMLALTKQKEWIVLNFSEKEEREKREKDIDEEIKMLLDNVTITIKELKM